MNTNSNTNQQNIQNTQNVQQSQNNQNNQNTENSSQFTEKDFQQVNDTKKLNLYARLALIQNELKAPKNQFNKFGNYNYRSCEDILEASKKVCLKYETTLVVFDEVQVIGNRFYVKANAELHDWNSNDVIKVSSLAREEDAKKGMDSAQVTGAASSYARKYALNGLFNIDDAKDPDTDEYRNQQNRQQNDYGRFNQYSNNNQNNNYNQNRQFNYQNQQRNYRQNNQNNQYNQYNQNNGQYQQNGYVNNQNSQNNQQHVNQNNGQNQQMNNRQAQNVQNVQNAQNVQQPQNNQNVQNTQSGPNNQNQNEINPTQVLNLTKQLMDLCKKENINLQAENIVKIIDKYNNGKHDPNQMNVYELVQFNQTIQGIIKMQKNSNKVENVQDVKKVQNTQNNVQNNEQNVRHPQNNQNVQNAQNV